MQYCTWTENVYTQHSNSCDTYNIEFSIYHWQLLKNLCTNYPCNTEHYRKHTLYENCMHLFTNFLLYVITLNAVVLYKLIKYNLIIIVMTMAIIIDVNENWSINAYLSYIECDYDIIPYYMDNECINSSIIVNDKFKIPHCTCHNHSSVECIHFQKVAPFINTRTELICIY